ncbi:MAG: alanine racemase [Armatimonadota bacterium]
MTPNNLTSWVEINTAALKHNLAEIRHYVGNNVKVMAVVKANAYGHGAIESAKVFEEAGIDYFGVTTLEEGLELRNAGISSPILAFSPLLLDQMETAILHNIDQTACDISTAEKISETSVKLNKTARIHIKVDTGMGRLGISADDCLDFSRRLMDLPDIEIAGVFTHFSDAGSKDLANANKQNHIFSILLNKLKAEGISTGLSHAANSSGILNLSDAHYDMVRPGTILYGQYPTRYTAKKLNLQDTWTLKTRIVALHRLPAGARVGYGGEYITHRSTVSAVIPVGYSDGFTLIPESTAKRASSLQRTLISLLRPDSQKTFVSINGKKAPIIGRVSMQMCSVDVTDLHDVNIGDEVILPARRTSTSSRITRVYI